MKREMIIVLTLAAIYNQLITPCPSECSVYTVKCIS